jgi:hypothetical protein
VTLLNGSIVGKKESGAAGVLKYEGFD